MSIITSPKIPKNFDHIENRKTWHFASARFIDVKTTPKLREKKVWKCATWNQDQLDLLVELRVLKCSMDQCGELLDRSGNSCCGAIQTHNLYGVIEKKRKLLIEKALNEHNSTKNSQDAGKGQDQS